MAVLGLLLLGAETVAGQHQPEGISLSGQVIPLWTRSDPGPGGEPLDDFTLVQPVFMAHASALGGRVRGLVTLSLEGLTMEDGELSPGGFGEGYVDRRHPHTYVHELMVSARDLLGRVDGRTRISLSAGKGFVAFGTDDPMSRPAVKYPVNHHFSQILERLVLVVGVRRGAFMLEGSLFNGDEPERPTQWPLLERFGDSWAVRGTVFPLDGVELQLSRAHVASPEHRPGADAQADQEKWSASARMERRLAGVPVYGLLEFARTTEAQGFFEFDSWLGEVAVSPGRHRAYYRLEITERPEEERLLNPFRTRRPHLENSIIGETRWTIHTAGYGVRAIRLDRLELQPFAEVAVASVTPVSGLFNPAQFYGDTTIVSLSLGVRLEWAMAGHRMGRYGVAQMESMNHAGP